MSKYGEQTRLGDPDTVLIIPGTGTYHLPNQGGEAVCGSLKVKSSEVMEMEYERMSHKADMCGKCSEARGRQAGRSKRELVYSVREMIGTDDEYSGHELCKEEVYHVEQALVLLEEQYDD